MLGVIDKVSLCLTISTPFLTVHGFTFDLKCTLFLSVCYLNVLIEFPEKSIHPSVSPPMSFPASGISFICGDKM